MALAVLAANAVFSVSGYSQLSTISYWAPISARSSTASAGCAHYMALCVTVAHENSAAFPILVQFPLQRLRLSASRHAATS